MKKLYITFYTTSEAIATELACKNNNIYGKLVPVPRILSAGCGIAFESEVSNQELIKNLLINQDIEFEGFSII